MPGAMQPLRNEHAELLPRIAELRQAADSIASDGDAGAVIEDSLAFLEQHLVPHATAEDEVLYPVVAHALGAARATDTMRRDHVAVAAYIGELRVLRNDIGTGVPDEKQVREAHRLLYGLHALVSVHFAKEEEIYVPILDAALSPEEAGPLFASIEHAATVARERLQLQAQEAL